MSDLEPKVVSVGLVDAVKAMLPMVEKPGLAINRRLDKVSTEISNRALEESMMTEEEKGKWRQIWFYYKDTMQIEPSKVGGRTGLMEAALGITPEIQRGGVSRLSNESLDKAFAPEDKLAKIKQRKVVIEAVIRNRAKNAGTLTLEAQESLLEAAKYTEATDVENDPEAAGRLAFMESALKVVPTVFRNGGGTRGATR